MAGPVLRPAAIVTDIEGTTTPVAFVHDVLFPYARARLPDFLAAHAQDRQVCEILAEAAELAQGRPVLAALLGWMDADAKVTPLKTLQGLIWRQGYERGDLIGEIYQDVASALRHWHAQAVRLCVYSSGSEAAQRLIFGHSQAGDLSGLFEAFFDTRIGPKRSASSYVAITDAIGLPAAGMMFLSDIEAELDAAAESGMRTCQLVRAQDGTIPSARHAQAASFAELDARFG